MENETVVELSTVDPETMKKAKAVLSVPIVQAGSHLGELGLVTTYSLFLAN